MRPFAARLVSISVLIASPAALAAQTLVGAPVTRAPIAALQQEVRNVQSEAI